MNMTCFSFCMCSLPHATASLYCEVTVNLNSSHANALGGIPGATYVLAARHAFVQLPIWQVVLPEPKQLSESSRVWMQERNKNGMELIPSDGNDFEKGKAKENDQINVVYIVDSDKLPF